MPISREEFEQGRTNLAFPIGHLLANKSDNAFTANEILEMLIRATERQAKLEEVKTALDLLISRRRVTMNEFEGEQWYTIPKRRLGFLRG